LALNPNSADAHLTEIGDFSRAIFAAKNALHTQNARAIVYFQRTCLRGPEIKKSRKLDQGTASIVKGLLSLPL